MDTEKRASIEGLLKYCSSSRQQQAIIAYLKLGTEAKAAKELGISRASLHTLIGRAKRQAAIHGWSPEHGMIHETGPAHIVKGTSTLYRDDEPILQWVKTSLKHDEIVQIMQDVVDEMKSDIKPAKPVALNNPIQLSELLNLYVLTDLHIGMRSWAEETGANWDLEIAEKTILDAFSHQVAVSPDAETGFFLQLGDALHYDGLAPVTPSSGHILDADGRFQKVVRTTIRIFRQCVNLMLSKHKRVIILHAQGNHDLASSVWLQEMFDTLYSEEPRVENIISPLPYYGHIHGEVFIGSHHGHKRKKLPDLLSVFQDQFRREIGQTRRTYIHTGHLHEDRVFTRGASKVERHDTLAARDAYAAHAGYGADRSLKCITYDHTAERGRSIYYPFPET